MTWAIYATRPRLFEKNDLKLALSELFSEKAYVEALQEVAEKGPYSAYNAALEKAPSTPSLNGALCVLNQFYLMCGKQKKACGNQFDPQTLITEAPPLPVAGPGLMDAAWAVPVFVERVWFAAGRVSGLTKPQSGEENITRPGYILAPLKWPFEALIGDKLPDRSSPSVAEPGLWDAVFAVPVFVGRSFFALSRACGLTKPTLGEEDITRPGYVLEPLKWLGVLVGRGVTGAPPSPEAKAGSVLHAIKPRYVIGETGRLRDPGALGPAMTYKVGQMVAAIGLAGMTGSFLLSLPYQPLAAVGDRLEADARQEAIADIRRSQSMADMGEKAKHYQRQATLMKGLSDFAPVALPGLSAVGVLVGLAMQGSVAQRSTGAQKIPMSKGLTPHTDPSAASQLQLLPVPVELTERE